MKTGRRVMTPGLWRWKDGEPASPAEIIHCAYVRWMLQDRRWQRMLWLRWFTVRCVMGGAFQSLATTWKLGRAIRRRTGKALWRQLAEQQAVLWQHGIRARWYYIFELFDDAQRARAGEFIHRFETKQALFLLLRRRFADYRSASAINKLQHFKQCRQFGIPTPAVLAIAREGRVMLQDGLHRLPDADLFVKLVHGKGGRGARRWLYRDGAFHSPEHGETLSTDALMRRLAGESEHAAIIVQPRLSTCRTLDDLSLGTLITVRVLSIRNEKGEVEITDAGLRMPRIRSPVDNVHAGGIAARVDIPTGRLSKATDLGVRPDSQWHAHHPATGATIEGRVLPFWRESLDLARRAHSEAFGDLLLVGWDIGLTDDGPILVESNVGPDVDGVQRRSRQPLGQSRFGAALAHLLTVPVGR